MSFDASRFSGPLGQTAPQPGIGDFAAFPPDAGIAQLSSERTGRGMPDPSPFHGEALARDPKLERYGSGIVLGFTAAFALFLIGMNLAGQVPGQSFSLKSISDILQFVGEGIGLFFCVRIALRLRAVSTSLQHALKQPGAERRPRNELALARTEAQAARRAYLAWTLLAIAIALYAGGQAVWTSYDVRMPSSQVPFPGLYDIGFVGSYPFFLVGTLLLTRRNRATVGRMRLVLDALAVLGASLALSWFFVLSPSIAGLSQAPSPGAAFLSIYFPTGDLFLVAVGAFLMFSPLANREQQPVFLRLCVGLFCLAITDSLLGYFSLSPSGFNTGTLQDILWPLSMSLVGLAAVEYPRSVAREQEREARSKNSALAASSLLTPGRASQISLTAQTVAPFLLALLTCAILLTVVPNLGGKSVLIQADLIALALILIVVVRQALTLIENNRLTMQMRGELVISRRELQVTRREADQANRAAQEKQALETGVAALQEIHARVARGDFSARAPTVPGPLLPIAISLNLMLDRLRALAQRGAAYEQLIFESRLLQAALDRLGQGLPPWPADQPAPRSKTELRRGFLGLTRLQNLQENQRHRLTRELESMSALTQRLGAALTEVMESDLFKERAQASYERMTLQRVVGAVTLLEQRLTALLQQTHAATPGLEQPSNQAYPADQGAQPAWQGRQSYYQPGAPKPYTNRTYQTPPFSGRSGEEYQD